MPDDRDFNRETDFYLKNGERNFKAEVKLNGQGNPESADAILERNCDIGAVNYLSQTMQANLKAEGKFFVEIRDQGWTRFGKEVLDKCEIPWTFDENWEENLDRYFDEVDREVCLVT